MISLLLLLLALVLGVLAQRNVDQRISNNDALWLYGAAAVLAAFAYFRLRLRAAAMTASVSERQQATGGWAAWVATWRGELSGIAAALRRRGRSFYVAFGGVLLAAVAAQLFRSNQWNAGFVLWITGLASLLAAAWLSGQPFESVNLRLPTLRRDELLRWARALLRPEAIALILILLTGLFLRLYRIDEIPAGLHNDSAWNGLYAAKLVRGIPFTPYTPEGGAGRETMHMYLTAGLIELIGPTITAIRLSSTFWSVLTLFLFYLLARELLGRRDSLLATFLLATATWPLVFGRVGWRAISTPFAEVFAFYFVVRALRSRRNLDYALAGVGLALCWNTYDAGRMGPIAVAGFLLFMLIRERGFWRHHYRGFALTLLTAVVALVPLGVYAGAHWVDFTNRAQQLSILNDVQRTGNLQPLIENLKTAALIFNYRANGNDFLIDQPLLDLPLAVFFVLGLVYALVNWRKPASFLILTWLVLSVVTGVFAIPNGNRAIGALAPTMLVAALFLGAVWDAATKVIGHRYQAVLTGVTVLVFAGMVYQAYALHLGPQRRPLYGMFEDGVKVGLIVNQLRDSGARIYLSDRYYVANTVRYVAYRPWEDPFKRPYEMFDPAAALTFGQTAQPENVAILLEPTDRNRQILDVIKSRFPGATVQELGLPEQPARPVLLAAMIPPNTAAATAAASNGLRARYYRGTNWEGQVVYDLIDPLVAINRGLSLPSFSVRWEGEIEAPAAGTYTFETLSDDGSFVHIDGKMVVDNGGFHAAQSRLGRVDLTQGRHQVEIRYFNEGSGMTMEVFWMPPGRGKEPLPASVLYATGGPEPTQAVASPAVPTQGKAPPASPTKQPAPMPQATPQPSGTPQSILKLEKPLSVPGGASLISKLGGEGDTPGRFRQPKDVAIAQDGSLYVADAGNGRVQRWDGKGKYLGQLGRPGDNPGELKAPLGLAIDKQNSVLVLDEETGYVNRFAPDGTFLNRFGGPEAGFFHPRGLAVGPDGTIYVADTGFARLVAFTPEGRKLREIGGKGGGPGQLMGPVGIAVDVEGKLWVADAENKRVQRLGPDGAYLGSFAIGGNESVDGPHLVLWSGGLYITIPSDDRVQAFSYDGRLLGQWGETGAGDGQLRRPVGIALGVTGNLWVVERDNSRVQEFQPPR